ncbi:hypothetical protein GGR52DRAFT_588864 [Hypoxylon sp. FL1284]|nr:hypothetical protein GGR52DRAFT_588864 [Hypoxylon sp. FL1284]
MAYRFAVSPPRFLQTVSASVTRPACRHPIAESIRRMATSTSTPPGKYDWIVIVPDKPGSLQKRLEVRPKHLEGLKPYVQSQTFKTGGAVLNEKPESDDPATWDWHGSHIVVVAESKEEVKKIIDNDIYTKSGVWDAEKALIFAAKFAFVNF